ncbi:alpha/beta hydrolase [Agromyces silvae]|uniref:alpha/beta hydrolase n=1 Tax=Agromyces silvae TaxID=3388266 RepID=UPI00280BDEF1|nr:alpha/beta fold hydrolase [Agromyces protaetiae]
MPHVTSADGTRIGYDRLSIDGPTLVLVSGGLDDGSENIPLGEHLAETFAVVAYRRRGRGDSGDTDPYAVEREVEDLAAVIDATGGPAHVFGASSGGALVLEAAAAGVPIRRIGVHEVPYLLGDEMLAAWRDYTLALAEALDADDRDEALRLFMRLAGSSDGDIAAAEAAPVWPALRGLAPTLRYDAACLGDGPPPLPGSQRCISRCSSPPARVSIRILRGCRSTSSEPPPTSPPHTCPTRGGRRSKSQGMFPPRIAWDRC